MNYRANRRDLQASFIAAAATLLTVVLNGPPDSDREFRAITEPGDRDPLAGLIDADQAQTEGAWLLDQPDAQPRLGFDPQSERLVWHVEGPTADVLLDAKTGEALEFRFD